MLPPEYTAHCTHPGCTWHVGTTPNRTTTPEQASRYRTELANQHAARYGHNVNRLDLP